MIEIKKDILPSSRRPGNSMHPDYITIHQTGNTSAGADAAMHSRYLHNHAPNPSWHYTVDDEIAVQHLPLNENGWHAADGGDGPGNRTSIGIEGCINSDGDYDQAVKNMAWLAAKLIYDGEVSRDYPDCLKQHHDWNSSRNCPAQIRAGKNGIGWEQFVELVGGHLDKMKDSGGQLPQVQRWVSVKIDGEETDIEGYLINNRTHIPALILEDLEAAEVTGHGDHITIEAKTDDPSVEQAIRILRQVVGLE